MNRNVESHFSKAPQVSIKRSRFDMSHDHKTTFNAGDIIPLDCIEVLPGDTFEAKTNLVVRMSTPVHPVMDNCFLDYYWFYVPNRLLWEHWEQFCGANDDITAWESPVAYEIPQCSAPSSGWYELVSVDQATFEANKTNYYTESGGVYTQCTAASTYSASTDYYTLSYGWKKGTIADYMGIPTKVKDFSVNALFFRAYCKIWNDWFRDENVMTPTNLPLSDSTQSGSNGSTYTTDPCNGGMPLKASKYHDYFTSALPFVQRGPAVSIPLGTTCPVYDSAGSLNLVGASSGSVVKIASASTAVSPGSNGNLGFYVPSSGTATQTSELFRLGTGSIVADLSNASSASINELRQAFQIQRLYEATARGGSRYIEILKGLFGVQSPDARLQRSEYLGGARIPINVNQVLQTSSSDSTSPQGNTAAYSLTSDSRGSFIKSFVEHGIILCLGVVRQSHTYQQGLDQKFTRKRRFDFYYPQLAHLGEQPVKNKELYLQGSSVINSSSGVAYDEEVFGYQEAWAKYRYQDNRVSGAFRSNYGTSLDVWHYADDYGSLPVLGQSWMTETPDYIDRTLAVEHSVEDQFIADFYFKMVATRPMPMYSIPGLIDHN